MASYLYQDINKIPGLMGNPYQKQKQYYERIGSPQGPYSNTAEQNTLLKNSMSKPNYGISQGNMQTTSAEVPLDQQYAEEAGANDVYQGPGFYEILPYTQAWESIKPYATEEAAAFVNPYVQRDLATQMRNYYANLASTGGGRSGRAIGQQGNLWATAEQNRKAQTLDWLAQREQGFKNLFYDPAQQAWQEATELGNMPVTPTWEELAKQMGYTPGTQPTPNYGIPTPTWPTGAPEQPRRIFPRTSLLPRSEESKGRIPTPIGGIKPPTIPVGYQPQYRYTT